MNSTHRHRKSSTLPGPSRLEQLKRVHLREVYRLMPRSKWRPCKARRPVRFPAVGSPLAPGGPASHLALKRTSKSLSDELPCQTTRCRELSAVKVFVAKMQKAIGGSPLSARISLTRKSSVVLGTTCTCHSWKSFDRAGHEIARRLSRPSNRRLLPPGDGTQASVKSGTSSGVQKDRVCP